jgi:hypothetical protein
MDSDIFGIYGYVLHYALIIWIVASAFFLFVYLWLKGRLDMDQEPAIQMMLASDEHPYQEVDDGRK